MSQPNTAPAYPPPGNSQPAGSPLTCPKCQGQMRTYERNGVYLEQCDTCRGIFLDYGELEHLTSIEARLTQPPPAQQPPAAAPYNAPMPSPYGPPWGTKGGHRYRRGGLSGLFFSS